LEQAQYYLDESLLLAQEIQNLWLIAETQGEYGWLLLDQKQPSEAKEMFERMLTGAQHIQAPELIARAFFGLAQVAAPQHNWEQARSFAQKSLERYTQLGECSHDHIRQRTKNRCFPPYTSMIRYCYTINITPSDRGTMDERSTEKYAILLAKLGKES
jgi:tetratricopeptide (TPR) repeat protein